MLGNKRGFTILLMSVTMAMITYVLSHLSSFSSNKIQIWPHHFMFRTFILFFIKNYISFIILDLDIKKIMNLIVQFVTWSNIIKFFFLRAIIDHLILLR